MTKIIFFNYHRDLDNAEYRLKLDANWDNLLELSSFYPTCNSEYLRTLIMAHFLDLLTDENFDKNKYLTGGAISSKSVDGISIGYSVPAIEPAQAFFSSSKYGFIYQNLLADCRKATAGAFAI